MRYISILITFIFFSTILEAAYLRTIRVGSFDNKADAQKELKELNSFVQKHENILSLQKEWGFEFKARKSGQYYATLVEPLTNRKVLQEVLDTLRIEYQDIYVTKLKQKNIQKAELKIIPEATKEVIVEKIIPLEPIKVLEVPSEENVIPVEEVIQTIKESKAKELEIVKTVQEEYKEKVLRDKNNAEIETSTVKHQESYLWQILFFLCLILLLIAIRKIFVYKKEKEVYINRDLINNAKIEQITEEVQNKDKFLAHTSHELRTPMTAIMGLTHLMLESELPTFQKDYVQRIENSANNLLSIINDILDISKIQAGELEIESKEFNLNDTIDYVLTIILMQANKNSTKISLDVDVDVPSRMLGDSLRLGQVLINILSNAVKFSHNGAVKINIKKLANYGEALRLEFIISDNGIGMSKEEVNTIFKSYSQADFSTSRKYGGTGLGLSISKQLIEMMHGEIFVESVKGEGSVFSFNLVFQLKDALDKRQYRLPSKSFLNKRVLVVDSSEENVNSLIKKLDYFHYKTHYIPSFEAAVLEDEMEFDLVIVHQTNLNSASIRKLKEMAAKETKIIIMNELYKNIRDDFFQGLHVDACLKTPLTQQSVLNAVIDLYASKNLDKTSVKTDPKRKLKTLRSKKILIAEDNELNHKVIASLLADTGIELTFVFDGQEAVDLIQAGTKFDLILMDINMPKLNGYEASEKIRKNNKYNNIHILALTADVMDSSIEKTLASGMQGHISKPIILDMFYHKIYQALNSKDDIINIMSISRPNEYNTQEEFEELSVTAGLGRCNGDISFYKSILVDFKAMYMNSPDVLEQLAKDSYFKEARSLAMDVKDVSLNVGAYNLCESAAAMEYEFEKGERSNWPELIGAYKISLGKLFKDVDKYLKKA